MRVGELELDVRGQGKKGWGQVPEWVFCSEDGKPLDGDTLRHRVFYRVLAKAGLRRLHFHDLRHTFASLLLAEGRAIHYVAEQLGHGAEQTLRTYGHVIADYRDRQAIDAEAEIRAARGAQCSRHVPVAV